MHKVNIAVLVSGSGTNLQTVIDAIEKGKINGRIAVVISDKEDAFALERAKKHNINAEYIPKSKIAEKLIDRLCVHETELVILGGFLSILGPEVVKKFEGRIINVHPSLIPSFCGKGFYGAKVHQAAVDYGVKVSGATVHFVDEGTDSGPIIMQETVNVDYDDTAETLSKKVLKIEHKLLPEAVKLFCEGRLEIIGRKVVIKDV